MEHEIKTFAEAITNARTKSIVESHVTELSFDEEANHLVIVVDNAGPLHELESEEGDHHLQNAMEKIYGDITYEVKLVGGREHERENAVPHNINQ